MGKLDRYTAQRTFKLDCGDTVSLGQAFIVTKRFTCEKNAGQTIHATLASIKEILENGIIHLKRLEWDLRHVDQK